MQKAKRVLNSWQRKGTVGFFETILEKSRWHLRRVARKLLTPPHIFETKYDKIDNSRVTLYTDDPGLYPNYAPRASNARNSSGPKVTVSLIASVKDEAENAEGWIKSVFCQTRLPDEIIIVDGGSVDGTPELIKRLAQQNGMSIRLLVQPGANIAQGRNLAIAQARGPVIAVTDFGCRVGRDWLEKIASPFEMNPNLRVAAGVFRPVDRNARIIRSHPQWRVERIKPQQFLPSSRSIAFRKDAWAAVSGYPEWLTMTGEDTYFDLELKRHGGEWAFVPEALVEWVAPSTLRSYLQKERNWSVGDGEAGVSGRTYWYFVWALGIVTLACIAALSLTAAVLVFSIQPVLLWIMLIAFAVFTCIFAATRAIGLDVWDVQGLLGLAAMGWGFLEGARRQREITIRRLSSVGGIFVILSGVPIDDTGGGARCTQIALELLRRGYLVVFVSKFPKYESKELDLKIAHPNLLNHPLSKFKWDRFAHYFSPLLDCKPLVALVEFPLPEFLDLGKKIAERNGEVVYDLLDDWRTSLGSQWYSSQVETEIIQLSRVLVATTPVLAARLVSTSSRPVTLLPNAVNTSLFNPHANYSRPPDMPQANWTAIYIGALWGEWFDWNLVVEMAQCYPEAAVVIIGDYQGQAPTVPVNLHFLGLKPQTLLPAYLAHADVAIVPWKKSEITQATSPLKIYEYLAMHRPVVAPDISPLQGIPGIFLAANSEEFLGQVAHARRAVFPTSDVDEFILQNNWQRRVKDLLDLVDRARATKTAVA